jgi:bifunctional DNA-binding transcriptional regulator/antitoxin component of YhaV-PrlF toxin-antitoxin module
MKADSKKLIDMVNKGMNAAEIRKAFGIKPKAPLRRMYYDALVKAGKIRDIVSERRVRKRLRKRRTLAIGKRGTILLSKPLLVNQLGFKEGDKFSVTKRRDRIVLKRTG